MTAIEELNALDDDDIEAAHSRADSILLEALRANGLAGHADAWEAACERIGFWYS